MNKFSINDWLTIQTRKDLTYIKRSLEHKAVNYAIFADMFIAILSFVLDHIFWKGEPEGGATIVAPSWYWIIVALLLFSAPITIFLYDWRKRKKYENDIKKVMPVGYLIDLFDNEICYNVMAADSMRDLMLDNSGRLEEEIQKFYFIETSYYANKAATQLFYFNNQGQNAIQTNDSLGGVAFVRFENVCEIISNIYRDLIAFSDEKADYKLLIEECRDYIFNFNELLSHMGSAVPELARIKQWPVLIKDNL